MDIKIDVTQNVDEDFWNKNLEQNISSSIYQVPGFLQVYQEVFNAKPFFIYVRNNGQLVGQLATLIYSDYFWKDATAIVQKIASKLNLGSILRWEYGPIIHDNKNKEKILSTILSSIDTIAIQHKVDIIKGSTFPEIKSSSDDIFQKYNYKKKNWATFLTDLTKESEDIFKTLNKTTRYDIRKAEKNNIEFEIAENFSSYQELVELSLKMKKKRGQKIKKHTQFYEKFWHKLSKHGYLQVFLARKDGELLGGIEVLIFNKNVHQYSVVNSEKTQFQSGSFLTWNAIKWSIQNKYRTFDMGGVNPEPENEKENLIGFYKSKWGGTQLYFSRYTKLRKNIGFKMYSVLNNPSTLTRKIKKILNN